MRLILKDYISQLKEKDELDLLLCDLLLQMGYGVNSIPKTGNRQYGVDIQADNNDEILLFVVKQGNINRSVWDDNQNSVRQSMNEILDVYLNVLPSSQKKKAIKIITVTNGVMDESIKMNWDCYVNDNINRSGLNLEFEFWGIDRVVMLTEKFLFDEHLFDSDMHSVLRKALYFIEEPDYKNIYFEKIIDNYINKLLDLCQKTDSTHFKNDKSIKKCVSALFLASQMIAKYAGDLKRFKISIQVYEYLMIRYWRFIFITKSWENAMLIDWLLRFCKSYEKWNINYFECIKGICNTKYAFPEYNDVEKRVQLYETVNFLTSFCFYLIETNTLAYQYQIVLDSIIALLNNNPEFYYAPYDCNISTVVMLCKLLFKINRKQEIENLLTNQTRGLMISYLTSKRYPSPEDTFSEAMDIYMGNQTSEYVTSAFWGTALLWIGYLRLEDCYNNLKDFLDKNLKEVTKCTWLLRADEEVSLYEPDAMHNSGDGIAISNKDNYSEFIKEIDFIIKNYENEIFSFEEYSFTSLEIIASRYFGTIPTVPKSKNKH